MTVDLRIFSDIEEKDFQRVSQAMWEVYGGLEDQEVLISEGQHYLLVRLIAEQMNMGKDIFDGRTRGGRFLKKAERNMSKQLINIYETDYGTVKLTIK